MTKPKSSSIKEPRSPLLARRIARDRVEVGRAYLIHARNGGVGVAVLENARLGYRLRREKLGRRYLFTEWDWDEGPPFGTAIPLRAVEVEPPTDEAALLGWLEGQERLRRSEIDAAWRIVRKTANAERGAASARETPLATLGRFLGDPDAAPRDTDEYADEYYRLAVVATEEHPRSVRAWSERANAAGVSALCVRGDAFAFWSDVIFCGHRLVRLGARKRGEWAWAEAALYTAGEPLGEGLDRRHGLRAMAADLEHIELQFAPPALRRLPGRRLLVRRITDAP